MKRPRTLIAVALGVALLASAAPASAADTAAYKHYVGCGLSKKENPSHACPSNSKKGAFFKSLKDDVFYAVCIKGPTGRSLCANRQQATKGGLYVNAITQTPPGRYEVTWFVDGKRVGLFAFRVTG